MYIICPLINNSKNNNTNNNNSNSNHAIILKIGGCVHH